MKSKYADGQNYLFPILTGAAFTCAVSLMLAAAVSALTALGTLPISIYPAVSCCISFVASAIGAYLCGRSAPRWKLPLCITGTAVYLLVGFVLRGLIFHTVGPKLWIIPLYAAVGCVIGALLSLRTKKLRII